VPKEAVYSHSDQRTKVEVGWARDRFVQVGSLRQAEPAGVVAYTSSDFPVMNTVGAAVVVTGGIVPPEPEPEWAGQFVDLDRHGLNQLIRSLRRARDQAYGRDE
jgi:hypothetical protein